MHPDKNRKLDKAIASYVNYKWNFPKEDDKLKEFVINLFKNKIGNKRIRITSIKEDNLILLQKHLKRLFKINSKIYNCKRYYELEIIR